MIEIKKGSKVLKVSQCAYNDTFKKLGYEVVSKSKGEAKKASPADKVNNDKLIEEEKERNKSTESNSDVVKSSSLKVNIIGENNENLDNDKEDSKSVISKVLSEKSNKSRGK